MRFQAGGRSYRNSDCRQLAGQIVKALFAMGFEPAMDESRRSASHYIYVDHPVEADELVKIRVSDHPNAASSANIDLRVDMPAWEAIQEVAALLNRAVPPGFEREAYERRSAASASAAVSRAQRRRQAEAEKLNRVVDRLRVEQGIGKVAAGRLVDELFPGVPRAERMRLAEKASAAVQRERSEERLKVRRDLALAQAEKGEFGDLLTLAEQDAGSRRLLHALVGDERFSALRPRGFPRDRWNDLGATEMFSIEPLAGVRGVLVASRDGRLLGVAGAGGTAFAEDADGLARQAISAAFKVRAEEDGLVREAKEEGEGSRLGREDRELLLAAHVRRTGERGISSEADVETWLETGALAQGTTDPMLARLIVAELDAVRAREMFDRARTSMPPGGPTRAAADVVDPGSFTWHEVQTVLSTPASLVPGSDEGAWSELRRSVGAQQKRLWRSAASRHQAAVRRSLPMPWEVPLGEIRTRRPDLLWHVVDDLRDRHLDAVVNALRQGRPVPDPVRLDHFSSASLHQDAERTGPPRSKLTWGVLDDWNKITRSLLRRRASSQGASRTAVDELSLHVGLLGSAPQVIRGCADASTLEQTRTLLRQFGTDDRRPAALPIVIDQLSKVELAGARPTATVVTPAGRKVEVVYEVRDVRELIPSHRHGKANPAYPGELQPRDRTKALSTAQISRIANTLHPELLGVSADPATGAPIIGPDDVVESGNARTSALIRLHGAGSPERKAAYLRHVESLGFDTGEVEWPVLVARRVTPMDPADRAAFCREANARQTLAMSVLEQAKVDATVLPGSVLMLYRGGDLLAGRNRDLVRAVLTHVAGLNETAAFFDDDGRLSQDGLRRVQGALLQKAYGDAALTGAVLEDTDATIRAIGGALLDVAPAWARMRAQVKEGILVPEVDDTDALIEAVSLVHRARDSGRSIAELALQGDMLGAEPSEGARRWLKVFFKDGERGLRPCGRTTVADSLSHYVDQAGKVLAGARLFGRPLSARDLVDATVRRRDHGPQEASLFSIGRPRQAARPTAAPQRSEDERPAFGPRHRKGDHGSRAVADEDRSEQMSVGPGDFLGGDVRVPRFAPPRPYQATDEDLWAHHSLLIERGMGDEISQIGFERALEIIGLAEVQRQAPPPEDVVEHEMSLGTYIVQARQAMGDEADDVDVELHARELARAALLDAGHYDEDALYDGSVVAGDGREWFEVVNDAELEVLREQKMEGGTSVERLDSDCGRYAIIVYRRSDPDYYSTVELWRTRSDGRLIAHEDDDLWQSEMGDGLVAEDLVEAGLLEDAVEKAQARARLHAVTGEEFSHGHDAGNVLNVPRTEDRWTMVTIVLPNTGRTGAISRQQVRGAARGALGVVPLSPSRGASRVSRPSQAGMWQAVHLPTGLYLGPPLRGRQRSMALVEGLLPVAPWADIDLSNVDQYREPAMKLAAEAVVSQGLSDAREQVVAAGRAEAMDRRRRVGSVDPFGGELFSTGDRIDFHFMRTAGSFNEWGSTEFNERHRSQEPRNRSRVGAIERARMTRDIVRGQLRLEEVAVAVGLMAADADDRDVEFISEYVRKLVADRRAGLLDLEPEWLARIQPVLDVYDDVIEMGRRFQARWGSEPDAEDFINAADEEHYKVHGDLHREAETAEALRRLRELAPASDALFHAVDDAREEAADPRSSSTVVHLPPETVLRLLRPEAEIDDFGLTLDARGSLPLDDAMRAAIHEGIQEGRGIPLARLDVGLTDGACRQLGLPSGLMPVARARAEADAVEVVRASAESRAAAEAARAAGVDRMPVVLTVSSSRWPVQALEQGWGRMVAWRPTGIMAMAGKEDDPRTRFQVRERHPLVMEAFPEALPDTRPYHEDLGSFREPWEQQGSLFAVGIAVPRWNLDAEPIRADVDEAAVADRVEEVLADHQIAVWREMWELHAADVNFDVERFQLRFDDDIAELAWSRADAAARESLAAETPAVWRDLDGLGWEMRVSPDQTLRLTDPTGLTVAVLPAGDDTLFRAAAMALAHARGEADPFRLARQDGVQNPLGPAAWTAREVVYGGNDGGATRAYGGGACRGAFAVVPLKDARPAAWRIVHLPSGLYIQRLQGDVGSQPWRSRREAINVADRLLEIEGVDWNSLTLDRVGAWKAGGDYETLRTEVAAIMAGVRAEVGREAREKVAERVGPTAEGAFGAAFSAGPGDEGRIRFLPLEIDRGFAEDGEVVFPDRNGRGWQLRETPGGFVRLLDSAGDEVATLPPVVKSELLLANVMNWASTAETLAHAVDRLGYEDPFDLLDPGQPLNGLGDKSWQRTRSGIFGAGPLGSPTHVYSEAWMRGPLAVVRLVEETPEGYGLIHLRSGMTFSEDPFRSREAAMAAAEDMMSRLGPGWGDGGVWDFTRADVLNWHGGIGRPPLIAGPRWRTEVMDAIAGAHAAERAEGRDRAETDVGRRDARQRRGAFALFGDASFAVGTVGMSPADAVDAVRREVMAGLSEAEREVLERQGRAERVELWVRRDVAASQNTADMVDGKSRMIGGSPVTAAEFHYYMRLRDEAAGVLSGARSPYDALTETFREALRSGKRFAGIAEARDLAGPILGGSVRPGTAMAKAVDEALERAATIVAQDIVREARDLGQGTREILAQLRALQDAVPRLAVRTSDSARRQAYSTPFALAALVSRLAGVTTGTTVYEPAAGNGALLLEADPRLVTANEIDPERAAALVARSIGHVTSEDATNHRPGSIDDGPRLFDRVVLNPPFGQIKWVHGTQKVWLDEHGTTDVPSLNPGPATSSADQAIAWQALQALKRDGRAVMLLAAPSRSVDKTAREQAYGQRQSRGFYKRLYETYRVEDHFTVDGKTFYGRQGAAWPIDVVVIAGRGRSSRALPSVRTPRLYATWEDLENDLAHDDLDRPLALQGGAGVEPGRDSGPSMGGGLPDGHGGGDRRPGSEGPLRESGSVAGPDAGAAGNPALHRETAHGGLGPDHLDGGGEPQSATDPLDEQSADAPAAERRDGAAGGSEPPVDQGDGGRSSARRRDLEPGEDRRRDHGSGGGMMKGRAMTDGERSQMTYEPLSRGPRLECLVPANLAPATQRAQERLASWVQAEGFESVDELVRSRLGGERRYPTMESLWQAFAAEQIDSVAADIHQVETGGSLVIGHQTGIGKGRINAARIVYAHEKGLIPVFVTERPDLYEAIMRDLADIGAGELKPLATDAGLTGSKAIPLPDGSTIATQGKEKHDHLLEEMGRRGDISPYDVILTTYAQAQTVKQAETTRRRALERLMPQASLIRDESHNAGGQEQDRRRAHHAESRAEWMREMNRVAPIVGDSSATWAKRPGVMDLYGRTALGRLGDGTKIAEAIGRGGIPLQQVVAAQLTDAGQYLRFERDMSGLNYRFREIEADHQLWDRFAAVLSKIAQFDDEKRRQLERGDLGKRLKTAAEAALPDGATGEVGVDSVNFASIMHNLVNQGLLAMSTEAAAADAIAALRRADANAAALEAVKSAPMEAATPADWAAHIRRSVGVDGEAAAVELEVSAFGRNDGLMLDAEGRLPRDRAVWFLGRRKPIIALHNTMGAAIEQFAQAINLQDGDVASLDFGGLLRRYLERSLDVTIGQAYGPRERRSLKATDYGRVATDLYREAVDLIEQTDWSGMPASPIDYLKWRLESAGYRVGEITGRRHVLDYGGGEPTYRIRPASETSKAAHVRTKDGFADGSVDAVIINQSGSSGIDLHAGAKFADHDQRMMIVLQPHPNVTTHQQLMGRPDRTGQVGYPIYIHPSPDIPAANRPNAVLAGKLAGLNANTIGARDGAFGTGMPDLLNEIGDTAAARLMEADPVLHRRLGYPLRRLDDGGRLDHDSAARKVTGRIAMLSVAEQARVYADLVAEYESARRLAERRGENLMEARALDLRARPVSRAPIPETGKADGRHVFDQPAWLEKLDVERLDRPYRWSYVQELLRDAVALPPEASDRDYRDAALEWGRGEIADLDARFGRYKKVALDRTPEARKKARSKQLDGNHARVKKTLQELARGQTVRVDLPMGADGARETIYGVVAGVERGGRSGNPALPSDWKARFIVADGIQELTVPFSQIAVAGARARKRDLVVTKANRATLERDGTAISVDIPQAFDTGHSQSREQRLMITGNILAGIAQMGTGETCFFSDDHGDVRAGVLLPRGFAAEAALAATPVAVRSASEVGEYLDMTPGGRLWTPDGALVMSRGRPDDQGEPTLLLRAAEARTTGGRYWLDRELLDLIVGEAGFVSSGDSMIAQVPETALPAVLSRIEAIHGGRAPLEAREFLDEAREITGAAEPVFRPCQDIQGAVMASRGVVGEAEADSGLSDASVETATTGPQREEPARPPSDRLLVMACTASKTETGGAAVRARDLYTGHGFDVLRGVPDERQPDLIVLSAEHGLLDGDDRIASYDRAMDPARALELARDPGEMAKAATLLHRPGHAWKEIVLFGGRDYRLAMRSLIEPVLPAGVRLVEVDDPGIGLQKQALKALLAEPPQQDRARDDDASADRGHGPAAETRETSATAEAPRSPPRLVLPSSAAGRRKAFAEAAFGVGRMDAALVLDEMLDLVRRTAGSNLVARGEPLLAEVSAHLTSGDEETARELLEADWPLVDALHDHVGALDLAFGLDVQRVFADLEVAQAIDGHYGTLGDLDEAASLFALGDLSEDLRARVAARMEGPGQDVVHADQAFMARMRSLAATMGEDLGDHPDPGAAVAKLATSDAISDVERRDLRRGYIAGYRDSRRDLAAASQSVFSAGRVVSVVDDGSLLRVEPAAVVGRRDGRTVYRILDVPDEVTDRELLEALDPRRLADSGRLVHPFAGPRYGLGAEVPLPSASAVNDAAIAATTLYHQMATRVPMWSLSRQGPGVLAGAAQLYRTLDGLAEGDPDPARARARARAEGALQRFSMLAGPNWTGSGVADDLERALDALPRSEQAATKKRVEPILLAVTEVGELYRAASSIAALDLTTGEVAERAQRALLRAGDPRVPAHVAERRLRAESPVHYSTGDDADYVTVGVGEEAGLEEAEEYAHFQAFRDASSPDMAIGGWLPADVPLQRAGRAMPTRFPGFVSEAAPGLAIVPFPAPLGADGKGFDFEDVRWLTIHRPTGALLGGARNAFHLPRSAARLAENLASETDWASLPDPRTLPEAERSRLGGELMKQVEVEKLRDLDDWHQAEIERFDRNALAARGFDVGSTWWTGVKDGTRPEIQPGVNWLFDDRNWCVEMFGDESVPVYLRTGRVADLTADFLDRSITDRMRIFWDYNGEVIKSSVLQELEQRRPTWKPDLDGPWEDAYQEIENNWGFDAFMEAVRLGEWETFGDWRGDLKDMVVAHLTDPTLVIDDEQWTPFDTVVTWSSYGDYGLREIGVTKMANAELAWDQLQSAIEAIRERREQKAERDKAWSTARTAEQRAEAAAERDEAVARFTDLGLDGIKELGFDPNAIGWLNVERAEFASVAGAVPEDALGAIVFDKREAAEGGGRWEEAAPIYVRRGHAATFVADARGRLGEREERLIATLWQQLDLGRQGIDSPAALAQAIGGGRWDALPRGLGSQIRDDLLAIAKEAGFHSARFIEGGAARTIVYDRADLMVAWDVLLSGKRDRRWRDAVETPALAAARRTATLQAPRLLLTGPDGRTTEGEGTVDPLQKADVARAVAGAGAILIFRAPDGQGRLYDADARRAHAAAPNQVSTPMELDDGKGGDLGCETSISAADLDLVAQAIARGSAEGAAIASVDAKGQLVVDRLHKDGRRERIIVDEQKEAALRDPANAAEVGKQRAEERRAAWDAKDVRAKYRDLELRARAQEVPALRIGQRFEVHGQRAVRIAAHHPMLKEHLRGEGDAAVTWFPADEQSLLDVGSALAEQGIALATTEAPDRKTWQVFVLHDVDIQVRESRERLRLDGDLGRSPSDTGAALWDEAKKTRTDALLFVRSRGEGLYYEVYDADAEAACRAAPLFFGPKPEEEAQLDGTTRRRADANAADVKAWSDLLLRANHAVVFAERGADDSLEVTRLDPERVVSATMEQDAAAGISDHTASTAERLRANEDRGGVTGAPSEAAPPAPAAGADVVSQHADAAKPSVNPVGYDDWHREKRVAPNSVVLVRVNDGWRAFAEDAETLGGAGVASASATLGDGRAVTAAAVTEAQLSQVTAALHRTGRTVVRAWTDPAGQWTRSEDRPSGRSSQPATAPVAPTAQPSRPAPGYSYESRVLAERTGPIEPPRDDGQLKISLDQAIDELNRNYINRAAAPHEVTTLLAEKGLLNATLHRDVAPHSRDLFPLQLGYVIYRNPLDGNRWHYDSMERFLANVGPDGHLAGVYPRVAQDVLSEYTGAYMRSIDRAFGADLEALRADIERTAEQINPHVEVSFTGRLFGDGRDIVDGGMPTGDRQPVLGLYFRLHQHIVNSLDLARGNPLETTFHELYHSMAPLLNEQERRTIAAAYPARGTRTAEESAAEAFAQWAMAQWARRAHDAGLLSPRATDAYVGTAARSGADVDPVSTAGNPSSTRAFGSLSRLIERMNNALASNGFQTWDDVFTKIAEGDVARKRAKVFDVQAEFEPREAARIAGEAGLDRLSSSLVNHAARMRHSPLTGEAVYRLLRFRLDDAAILETLRKAGYYTVVDRAGSTTLLSTRSRLVAEAIEQHRRVTPFDVDTSERRATPTAPNSSTTGLGSQARAGGTGFGQRALGLGGRGVGFRTMGTTNLSIGASEFASNQEKLANSEGNEANSAGSAPGTEVDSMESQGIAAMIGEDVSIMTDEDLENLMRRAGDLPGLPRDATVLFISPSEYRSMVKQGTFPANAGDDRLVYEAASGTWHIAKDHPEHDRMAEQFGTDRARDTWTAERAEAARIADELSGQASLVPQRDRVYLFLSGSDARQEADRIGAAYDRQRRQYFVSQRHPEIQAIRERFATPAAKAAWEQQNKQVADRDRKMREAADRFAQFSRGQEVATGEDRPSGTVAGRDQDHDEKLIPKVAMASGLSAGIGGAVGLSSADAARDEIARQAAAAGTDVLGAAQQLGDQAMRSAASVGAAVDAATREALSGSEAFVQALANDNGSPIAWLSRASDAQMAAHDLASSGAQGLDNVLTAVRNGQPVGDLQQIGRAAIEVLQQEREALAGAAGDLDAGGQLSAAALEQTDQAIQLLRAGFENIQLAAAHNPDPSHVEPVLDAVRQAFEAASSDMVGSLDRLTNVPADQLAQVASQAAPDIAGATLAQAFRGSMDHLGEAVERLGGEGWAGAKGVVEAIRSGTPVSQALDQARHSLGDGGAAVASAASDVVHTAGVAGTHFGGAFAEGAAKAAKSAATESGVVGDHLVAVGHAVRDHVGALGVAFSGLSTAADMAVTGGATAALTATAMWWARRQARLGERERVAREAPWMLTPREFASVASRLYKVERCETDAGRVTSLVDRTTNTPLFSIQHEKDAPLSKRELLTAAHLEMVEEASRVQGLTVPPRVAQAHLDEAMRTTPPGFAAYGRRAAALGQLVGLGQASDTGRVTMAASQASVGAAAGGAATQAAAEKFWESVPVIRLSPDAPAERREKIAAQVRQLPPERQDAVRDRTAQRYADLAKSGNLAEAAKLQAGLSVLATEMAQRRVAAELERGAPSGNRGRGRKSADRGMGL